MPHPSLSALLAQFQRENPDHRGNQLLEAIVTELEAAQLRIPKAEEFPFVIGDGKGAFYLDPVVAFGDGPAPAIGLYSKAPPVRVEGRGFLIGWMRVPEAVVAYLALGEALRRAGQLPHPGAVSPAAEADPEEHF